jgi:hypothetical protein
MSDTNAARNQRSIVHHQLATAPLSTRLTMIRLQSG